jgi:hypothetical protein
MWAEQSNNALVVISDFVFDGKIQIPTLIVENFPNLA